MREGREGRKEGRKEGREEEREAVSQSGRQVVGREGLGRVSE